MQFLRDPDTEVRIKAEGALGDVEGLSGRISPLGNACIGLMHALEQKWPKAEISRRDFEIQTLCLAMIRQRIATPEPGTKAWMKDPDLVSRHIAVTTGQAPQSQLCYKLDKPPGWKGDELYVSALKWFMSDTYRASFGVWPGRPRGTVGCGMGGIASHQDEGETPDFSVVSWVPPLRCTWTSKIVRATQLLQGLN